MRLADVSNDWKPGMKIIGGKAGTGCRHKSLTFPDQRTSYLFKWMRIPLDINFLDKWCFLVPQ